MTDTLRLGDEYVAMSPLRGRPVFLLATPESGAELLLHALGELEGATALPVPTHMFSQGAATLFDRWVAGEESTRPQGMAELVDEQEFFAAVRGLTDTVLASAVGLDGDDRVMEYSKGHIFQTGVIAAIYPDADLVHVVRDGRKVVSRGVTPLHDWSAREGARRWREDQEAVTAPGELPNLHVVRFEDLVTQPAESVKSLVDVLHLAPSPADVDAAVAILARGAAGALDPPLPHPAAIVELLAGDVLEAYGYTLGDRGKAHRNARIELGVESAVLGAREQVNRVLHRLRDAAQRAQAEQ